VIGALKVAYGLFAATRPNPTPVLSGYVPSVKAIQIHYFL
jgi:hypothetical protein